VLRLMDGPIALLPCISKIAYRRCADCSDEATCEIRRVFFGVAESARQVLDKTTLADVAPSSMLASILDNPAQEDGILQPAE
jgi:DNA-binding IscR family transcriptional regulator